MKSIWQLICGLLVFLLAGCSYQTVLDKFASRERQSEIAALASRLCTEPDTVVAQLHPEIRSTLIAQKSLLQRECPQGNATWQLVSYEWKVNVDNGVRDASESATLVSPAGKGWSTVQLVFQQQGSGRKQIVRMNVVASDAKPPALAFVETWDRNVGIVRIVGAVIILAIAGLIFWLVRRYQRRKKAL